MVGKWPARGTEFSPEVCVLLLGVPHTVGAEGADLALSTRTDLREELCSWWGFLT